MVYSNTPGVEYLIKDEGRREWIREEYLLSMSIFVHRRGCSCFLFYLIFNSSMLHCISCNNHLLYLFDFSCIDRICNRIITHTIVYCHYSTNDNLDNSPCTMSRPTTLPFIFSLLLLVNIHWNVCSSLNESVEGTNEGIDIRVYSSSINYMRMMDTHRIEGEIPIDILEISPSLFFSIVDIPNISTTSLSSINSNRL